MRRRTSTRRWASSPGWGACADQLKALWRRRPVVTGGFARMAFPNESPEYRAARDTLLDTEIALRRQSESAAALRRALPPGGEVPEDFVSAPYRRASATRDGQAVRVVRRARDADALQLHVRARARQPCPGCTHLLDGIEGAARHLPQRAAFYVVARSPIARLAAWAHAAAGIISRCSRPRAMPTATATTAGPPR